VFTRLAILGTGDVGPIANSRGTGSEKLDVQTAK
jgi:hypothetical protein